MPPEAHVRITRALANALEQAAGERYAVATDIDLRLSDVPLLNLRPDIVVSDASIVDNILVRPAHCLLVVEVMSGTFTTDRSVKPAEYAAAGIRYFWRIEDIDEDQRSTTVSRYRLDPTTHRYAPAGMDSGALSVRDPIELAGLD